MELVKLTVRRHGIIALNDLSLVFPDGRISALIGSNGAGKTSLLRYLSGQIQPVEGFTLFEGSKIDLRSNDWRAKLGIVPDDDALFTELTVSEQLALAATCYGLTEAEGQNRIEKLLSLFDLGEKRDALGRELSAGMKKRVSLALALIHGPRVFLMDEPLNALDYISGETFFRLLATLKDAKRTVIISGHHVAALIRVADRVIELEKGRLKACVDIEQGSDSMAILERLGQVDTDKGEKTNGDKPNAVYQEPIDLHWIRR